MTAQARLQRVLVGDRRKDHLTVVDGDRVLVSWTGTLGVMVFDSAEAVLEKHGWERRSDWVPRGPWVCWVERVEG